MSKKEEQSEAYIKPIILDRNKHLNDNNWNKTNMNEYYITDKDFKEGINLWLQNVSNNPQIPEIIKNSWIELGVVTNQEALYNTPEIIE